ncbi:PhzF family phenazine biosynthesis protein, partial [Candidatus Gottesmanbacteria bacterium]|nr:PhzF family phenazine biosynthesis protein [Candidatus Gottesmanbacteria bacterium]
MSRGQLSSFWSEAVESICYNKKDMGKNIEIHIVRVFINPDGKFGNPVGIILDEGRKINLQKRQKIATELGFSESVFINDKNAGRISIHNPQREILFAGHATLGTAWFINKLNDKPIESLECKGGHI